MLRKGSRVYDKDNLIEGTVIRIFLDGSFRVYWDDAPDIFQDHDADELGNTITELTPILEEVLRAQ